MPKSWSCETVLILDFGSQYTQLIARRIRELGVYCEIHPYNAALDVILREKNIRGIIWSGGPCSVYENGAPHCSPNVMRVGVPILGICYGLQLIAHFSGGTVAPSEKREFGNAVITVDYSSKLMANLPSQCSVWMSHGDHISILPAGFKVIAETSHTIAAVENTEEEIYGLQFHPEVVHTPSGKQILGNFLFLICRCQGDWTTTSFIKAAVQRVQDQVQDGYAICGLSGGVDSAVAAALVERAIGNRLTCVFVDNGLLRKNEFSEVLQAFSNETSLSVKGVSAGAAFLNALSGISDPEQKRKIIGREFIEVFQEEAGKLTGVNYLVQGTLYPDVIESQSVLGPSAVIKSHHNVGGLPEKMNLRLIEPLRDLFKDEVRAVGKELDLPSTIIDRQPFPGPGLAVRILGEVDAAKVLILQDADEIVRAEIAQAGLTSELWQSFAVLIPIRTVGVMGDQRTYDQAVAIRTVVSQDGMTADWGRIPYEVLARMSSRIINEVKGINRVVYDISSKPPSTIEWE